MKKKWLIISGAVLLVLVVVIVAVMVGRPSQEETPIPGKPAVGGTIKLPNGSKVGVAFNGPLELEIAWKQLEALNDYELRLMGTIKNKTTETVQFELAFILDGVQCGKWPQLGQKTLSPGEEGQFAIGILAQETSKRLEVKVVDYTGTGESPTTPITTTPEPSNTPTQTPTLAYEKNPKTPTQTVITFLGLVNEKKYKEAENLITGDNGTFFGFLEKEVLKNRKIVKTELIEEVENGENATVRMRIYFDGGDKEIINCVLKMMGGKWKIVVG